ncbi:signal peptidase II [Mesorhizobium delmotii]|uniref:Lipoprotein signal peptidase n=1 Tax=Mesorhizobium delmotii TaxID=1631247 RepID=A0A2P9ARE2_9HYPH|nr:signal peptidase II [Mesorhizobium delmotii]SJM33738.1 Lipoprotein signal peptidase [Mesorhizobium delmotii]
MAAYRIEPANLMFALLFMISAVSADQFAKTVMVELVMQPPRSIPVTSFFNLTLSYNEGVSFGLFADFFKTRPQVIIVATSIVALILILWAAVAKNRTEVAALGLISGGAIGNIVDRFQRGAVTDFIDMHLAGWHWPAFNLADVAIVGGAALLATASFVSGSPSGEHTLR